MAVRLACLHVDGNGRAAHERLALHERRDALLVVLARFHHGNVGEAQVWIESARPRAVHAAQVAGANAVVWFLGGIGARIHHRPPVLVERCPVEFLHVDAGVDESAGGAIEDVEEAVAVGLHDGWGDGPVALDVDEEQLGVAVVVPHVVGRELEVPKALAGVGIYRQQAVGVEVVAGAQIAVPVRRGVAGGPIEHVGFGIVGAAGPSRSAARLPRIASPRLHARFAFHGHGVVAPAQFAGGHVVGVEEAAHAELAAGNADHGHVLDDHGHGGGAEALVVFGQRHFPLLLAGEPMERHHLGIQSRHQHQIAAQCRAPDSPCRSRASCPGDPAADGRSASRSRRSRRSARTGG